MDTYEHDQKLYWNKEVADLLQIGDSTLRRWCLMLEERGYQFMKNEHNQRGFRDHEVLMFRKLKELTKSKGKKLEDALDVVLSMYSSTNQTTLVQSNPASGSPSNDVQNTLAEKIEQVLEINRQLVEYIRTRDDQFLDQIKELNETRLQLAAVSEQKEINERQERITDMITLERIKAKLRKEAFEKWSAKPEAERIRRTGFLGLKKEEDHVARDLFVRNYVDDHLSDYLSKEFKL